MKLTPINQYQVVIIKLSDQEYEQIEDLAACNYTVEKIAMYLSQDPVEFVREYNKPESLIRYHFEKGILTANFEIDSALLKNAKTGNITAVDTFQKRQESVLLHNLKRKFLNNGY